MPKKKVNKHTPGGTINPKVSDNLPLRLNYLFEEVELIINKFSPDIFSIEDNFSLSK